MKKLMILGAGIYQVPLIKKAKAIGLETIVVSVGHRGTLFALHDKELRFTGDGKWEFRPLTVANEEETKA